MVSDMPRRKDKLHKPARMVHYYCPCDRSKALCGKKITEVVGAAVEVDCVVCGDLVENICPKCGGRG